MIFSENLGRLFVIVFHDIHHRPERMFPREAE